MSSYSSIAMACVVKKPYREVSSELDNMLSQGDVGISEDLTNSWIEAIKNDDEDKVRQILEEIGDDLRTQLLKDKLPDWTTGPCGHKQCDCYPFYIRYIPRYTVYFALAGPSPNVLRLILKYKDVDIFQEDYSMNILHSLVYFAYFRKQHRRLYVECYKWLASFLSVESLAKLLKQENHLGLNPLELAAHLDVFSLFTAIINTKGIYLVKEDTRHIWSYKWYNVTDYAHPGSGRFEKSPLLMFSMVDHSKLAEKITHDFHASSFVSTWFQRRSQALRSCVAVCNFIYLLKTALFILLFYTSVIRDGLFPDDLSSHNNRWNYSVNNTDGHKRHCFDMVLPISVEIAIILLSLIYAVGWLLGGISWLPRARRQYKTLCNQPYHTKRTAVDPLFYIYIEIILNVSVILKVNSAFLGYFKVLAIPLSMTRCVDTTMSFGLVWSLTFVLLSTKIGPLVIMIQNMLGDLTRFAFVFVLFQMTFCLAFFMNLTSYGKVCDLGHPGFNGMFQSFYGMFGLMLNTLSVQSYKDVDTFSFAILHILYVFMVPIMLINLLIALFSDTVSTVAHYQSHILTFQRFMVDKHFESTIRLFFPCYHRKILNSMYAHDNNIFYLIVTETEDMAPLQKLN